MYCLWTQQACVHDLSDRRVGGRDSIESMQDEHASSLEWATCCLWMPVGWIEMTTFHVGMPTSEPRVFLLISCHRVGTSALGMSPTLGFIPPFFLAAFSFVGYPATVGWRASCRWSILGGPEVQVPISPRTNRDLFDRDLGALARTSIHLGLGSRPCVAFPIPFRSSFRTRVKPNHPIRVSLGRTASPHPRDLVSDHREEGPFDRDLLASTSIPSPSRRVPQEIDLGYADWTGGSPPPKVSTPQILWPLLCTTTPRARVGNRPEPHANEERIHARTCAGIGRRAKRKKTEEGRPVGHRSVSTKRSTWGKYHDEEADSDAPPVKREGSRHVCRALPSQPDGCQDGTHQSVPTHLQGAHVDRTSQARKRRRIHQCRRGKTDPATLFEHSGKKE